MAIIYFQINIHPVLKQLFTIKQNKTKTFQVCLYIFSHKVATVETFPFYFSHAKKTSCLE